MKPSDYFGFGVAFGFGIWFLLFPQGVINFYTWFHQGKVKLPKTFGIRLSGAVWLALMFIALIIFLMH